MKPIVIKIFCKLAKKKTLSGRDFWRFTKMGRKPMQSKIMKNPFRGLLYEHIFSRVILKALVYYIIFF